MLKNQRESFSASDSLHQRIREHSCKTREHSFANQTDYDSTQLRDLGRELNIYIDNVRADERFANLNTISELAKLIVVQTSI
jgi:hypothetical protein